MNLIFNLQLRQGVFSNYKGGQYCYRCNGMVGTLEKIEPGGILGSYRTSEYMCSPYDVLVHASEAEDADIKCSKYKKLRLKRL